MSFEAPGRLAVVRPAVCLLVVVYSIIQRGRRKYMMRFTSVDLVASVVPRRPSWHRHISAAVLLLAMVALVIGLARPATTSKVPKKRGTILLTIDASGSMNATDVAPTRLRVAQAAASQFVTQLPPGLKIGLISFNATARAAPVAPTPDHPPVPRGDQRVTTPFGNRDRRRGYHPSARGCGCPAPRCERTQGVGGDRVDERRLPQPSAKAAHHPKHPSLPQPPRPRRPVFPSTQLCSAPQTIPVCLPIPPRWPKIASEQRRRESFTATTVKELSAVYDQVRRTVGYDTVKHDITTWWLAAGLLLALLAATRQPLLDATNPLTPTKQTPPAHTLLRTSRRHRPSAT